MECNSVEVRLISTPRARRVASRRVARTIDDGRRDLNEPINSPTTTTTTTVSRSSRTRGSRARRGELSGRIARDARVRARRYPTPNMTSHDSSYVWMFSSQRGSMVGRAQRAEISDVCLGKSIACVGLSEFTVRLRVLFIEWNAPGGLPSVAGVADVDYGEARLSRASGVRRGERTRRTDVWSSRRRGKNTLSTTIEEYPRTRVCCRCVYGTCFERRRRRRR